MIFWPGIRPMNTFGGGWCDFSPEFCWRWADLWVGWVSDMPSRSKLNTGAESHIAVSFRLWHWFNAPVVFLLLMTVFLRKTFLSYKGVALILGEKLRESGVPVQDGVLKDAARAVRDGMWQWHYPLGFVLGGLFLFRIFLAKESFPGLKTWKARFHSSFYLASGFMVLSGCLMYFSDTLGLSEGIVDGIEEIHETAMWYFVGFIVLHLAGVIRAEVTEEPGIVSRMIHGKRP